jgi:hypothetical protein
MLIDQKCWSVGVQQLAWTVPDGSGCSMDVRSPPFRRDVTDCKMRLEGEGLELVQQSPSGDAVAQYRSTRFSRLKGVLAAVKEVFGAVRKLNGRYHVGQPGGREPTCAA